MALSDKEIGLADKAGSDLELAIRGWLGRVSPCVKRGWAFPFVRMDGWKVSHEKGWGGLNDDGVWINGKPDGTATITIEINGGAKMNPDNARTSP